MAGETTITVIGNLTADPELRFTQSGAAVANFTIASTPRVKRGDQWEDGDPLFLRCNIWRQAAENVAESLTRGARVIASGRLQQRSYETREGEKRTVIELAVDEIGPSLKYATCEVRKVARTQAGASYGQPSGGYQSGQAPADDPWGSAPPPPSPQGWGGGFSDEPPF